MTILQSNWVKFRTSTRWNVFFSCLVIVLWNINFCRTVDFLSPQYLCGIDHIRYGCQIDFIIPLYTVMLLRLFFKYLRHFTEMIYKEQSWVMTHWQLWRLIWPHTNLLQNIRCIWMTNVHPYKYLFNSF